MRLPSFFVELVDPDEAHYLLIARGIVQGRIPFVDLVDKKPLLTYLLYVPAGAIGFGMMPMKLLGLLWLWGTCMVVGKTVRLWTAQRPIEIAAAWLYALISSCNSLAIHAELLMNLPVAAAMYFFVLATRRESKFVLRGAALSGLCLGLATLFRHQAGVFLGSLGLVMFLDTITGPVSLRVRGVFCVFLLGLSFAAPWIVAALCYCKLGYFAEFWDWNVSRNFTYVVNAGSDGKLLRLGRGLLLYVILAAPLPWWFALVDTTRKKDTVWRVFLMSLCLTWIPVSMGSRYWSQYFVQFAVPLSLLAAPSLVSRWRTFPALSLPRSWAWAVGLLGPLIVFDGVAVARFCWNVFPYPSREPRALALGSWIKQHTRPDDQILVWGYNPPIYVLAERMPGTRYVTTAVHLGDIEPTHVSSDFDPASSLSQRDIDLVIQDLELHRPAMIVDTAGTDLNHWSPFPLTIVPQLFRYVEQHYIASPGPHGSVIYQLRDTLAVH